MTDNELAKQLLSTPTGMCTSTAYGLFRKYDTPRDPIMGPFDDEILACLRKLAKDVPKENTTMATYDPAQEISNVMQTFVKSATRTEPSPAEYSAAHQRLDYRTMRLLHAAIGLCTEAGEFIDQLKKHIFYGKPLDHVNLIEELGDAGWYERIAVDALEIKYLDLILRNINKLQTRFPEKFTEEKAQNRDLVTERVILESEAESYPATASLNLHRKESD